MNNCSLNGDSGIRTEYTVNGHYIRVTVWFCRAVKLLSILNFARNSRDRSSLRPALPRDRSSRFFLIDFDPRGKL